MAAFDIMDAPKEEQVRATPVKLEFDPFTVEISSSSEKSFTGQSLETGEEATSSSKRSTSPQHISAENLHKKPRLHAHTVDSHENFGGRESNTSASDVADGILLNDATENQNLHTEEFAADNAVHVVGVGDDDLPDDFLEPLDSPLASSPPTGMHIEEPIHGQPSALDMAKLMFKQFWRAGDYDNVPSTEDLDFASGMEHIRVHPKFLHSNATSHKWALGAIAELLDNALDEAVNGAALVNVDMIRNPRNGRPMLMIEDDGGGMDPERMRQCMSLGYSAKSKVANTIGQYGNGFKTSTMRLGADVVVFSRHKSKDGSLPTQSIGLLSYTFLTGTGQDDIIVPMVDYEVHPFGLRKLVRGTLDDWNRNLETLLQWSPYNTEKDLLDQFKQIDGQGTNVIVYNLWEDEDGDLELDFDADPHDIQLRGANRDEKNSLMASKYPNCKHFFTHKYSLRSYASILYLRLPKKFKMFLRGKQVVHHRVVSDLMLIEQVKYKPVKVSVKSHRDAVTVVTLGFVKDAKEHIDVQGYNVYHKNRLIKPFWRVWNYPGIQGRGIFGVLEANFVEPAHDKQGFERTTVFARLETRLIEIQKSYWLKNCKEIGYVGNVSKKKAPSKAEGAGDDPSSERTASPGVPSTVPLHKRGSLSLSNSQKSTQAASLGLDKDQVQAGQSIASSGTEAMTSQSKTQICAVRAASHTPPLSGKMGRVSSTHSLAELGTGEDDRSIAIFHTSAASMPFISRKGLESRDIVQEQPSAQTSRPSEAIRRVDRLKITSCVRVTRSQAIEEQRVEGVRSHSGPAQTSSAEVLSKNGDDSELQPPCGSNDGLEGADKSALSLLAHTGATIDEIDKLTFAALESYSKDTQLVTHTLANNDHLISSNYVKVLGAVPSLTDIKQAALVSISDELLGLHSSSTGDPNLPADGNQAALVSRSDEPLGLHSSSEGDLNLPDGDHAVIVSRSDEPLGLHSSSAEDPNLPDGNHAALVSRSDEPLALQSSSVGDPVTFDASHMHHLCLMFESFQDSNEALISPSSQAPDSSQCTSGNAANGSLTSPRAQERPPRILTRSMLQLRQSHARAARLEGVNSPKFGNEIQQSEVDGTTDAVCIAKTTVEEGDASASMLVAIDAEHTVSINTLEEKLSVMKQRLRGLQVDLDQIYSERDCLKEELEDERNQQSLVEEELKKRLQAVSSRAQELEAANKLLQVCQR